MKSLRLTIMLILIMVITPVVAAFGHYSEIAGPLLIPKAVTVDVAGDSGISISNHSDHCQTDNTKSNSGDCTVHGCVGCAITSSFRFAPTHSAHPYSYLEKTTSISLLVFLDIKPPITR